MLPLFQTLSEDDQDSVRLLAVENFTPFAGFFTNEQKTGHLLPMFKRLAEDKAWRVRYMIASNYVEVSKGQKKIRDISNLVPIHRSLKLLVNHLSKNTSRLLLSTCWRITKGRCELLQQVNFLDTPNWWTNPSSWRNCCPVCAIWLWMKTNTLVLPSQRTLVGWLLSLVKKRKSKASQIIKHYLNSHRLF